MNWSDPAANMCFALRFTWELPQRGTASRAMLAGNFTSVKERK
jgi:hypothetical protein